MSAARTGGVIMAVSGALLVAALLLDWWEFPSAFENPDDLPRAAAFVAEAVTESGQPLDADAFEFFEFRDLAWLVIGVCGSAVGLALTAGARIPLQIRELVLVLVIGATLTIAATLIWPPDYADSGPEPREPFDFGVDLPLGVDLGGLVALAAALGLTAGATVGVRSGQRARRPSG
jgi:hypothetical protein